jgi:hypothetical protein
VSANGLHWADNQIAPYDYGDVTLMGEAAGLIMRKTAGGKTLYQVSRPLKGPQAGDALEYTNALHWLGSTMSRSQVFCLPWWLCNSAEHPQAYLLLPPKV